MVHFILILTSHWNFNSCFNNHLSRQRSLQEHEETSRTLRRKGYQRQGYHLRRRYSGNSWRSCEDRYRHGLRQKLPRYRRSYLLSWRKTEKKRRKRIVLFSLKLWTAAHCSSAKHKTWKGPGLSPVPFFIKSIIPTPNIHFMVVKIWKIWYYIIKKTKNVGRLVCIKSRCCHYCLT